ncbi:helix-hairpin-helix domain-containing protein [Lactobacillus sp. ESL0228]|uniref:helix-hairpin-helix domain-containing protein n=1 Tax=Lactobacillus sp. ESL0228 TaxID=2069352 RepID=UPI000EFBFA30|nr:helix-hairpin-helix domain-containing protein [Lactobacillus sp. ESL0228]RMC48727.1 ComEA family DNA-binding protein [Lactobacillus sp. ESL0228]
MDWKKIKSLLIEYKMYVFVGIIVLGFFLWHQHDTSIQNNNQSNLIGQTKKAEQNAKLERTNTKPSTESQVTAKSQEVTCDISGAIRHQGVYTLKKGARLEDLIEVAGGTTKRAQLNNVNRALILKDQDKIHIPYTGEKIKQGEIVTSVGGQDGAQTTESVDTDSGGKNSKVNINTAGAQDLQKLNGIGEKKAAQIIAYRQKNGQFKRIEDLKKVSGIGDKTFAALKNQLEV